MNGGDGGCAMAGVGFPTTLEEVTTEWLTHVLRADGVLDGACVSRVSAEPLGAGVGFMSAMRRLRLDYDDPACSAPRSVIVKLTPPDPGSRVIDEAFNFYEKEVAFYREVAASTPIRAPRAHFGAYAPATRDFALILEDLAPLEVGDQLEGLSVAQCALALDGAAGLHGRWWRAPALDAMDWLITIDSPQIKLLAPIFAQCWPKVVEFLGEAISPQMHEISARFAPRIEAMLEKAAAMPRTVIHGDYRADNLFYGGAADAFAVADWQIVLKGPGAFDVAYLLAGSLDLDLRRRHEADLLAAYHHALCAYGVEGYSFADFREDYRACVMLSWCWPVTAIGNLDMANARGVALFRAWTDRTMAAILDLDAGATIP